MKKLFLSLVAAIVAATATYSQNTYVATLNHEGSITPYYGSTAFNNAYSAAVDGDVITLSPGTFTTNGNFLIDKAITIRGAGMMATEGSDSGVTIFQGYYWLSGNGLTVEGINFDKGAGVDYISLTNATFTKCKFHRLYPKDNIDNASGTNKMENCTFINCVFSDIHVSRKSTGTTLHNCHVSKTGTYSYYKIYNTTMFNCFVNNYSTSFLSGSNLTNCIVYGSSVDASNQLVNCAGTSSTKFSNVVDQTGCYNSDTGIFKSWDDAISTDNFSVESYELSNEGKALLGVDGTEVGMLGGNYPYNPVVSLPLITKCEVAEKATADGKLSVNIEVTAPNE